MVARGEVWWHEAPDEGRRPYLVLTRDQAIPFLSRVIGVPTTRTIRRIPTEIPLDRSDGMPVDCVLTTDNLTLVPKADLTTRITMLSAERLREVCEALAYAIACDDRRP